MRFKKTIEKLNKSISDNDVKIVKSILDNKVFININEKDENGYNPFLKSISNNNYEITQILIEYAIKNDIILEINENDIKEKIKIYKNDVKNISEIDIKIIELLYKYKNNDRVEIIFSENSELLEIFENIEQFIKKLEEEFFEVIEDNDTAKFEEVIENININTFEMVELLMNYEDSDGNTPLIIACKRENENNEKDKIDNENIVKCLIENGAKVNKKNKDGDIALSFACHNGNEVLVKYLIDNGSDVNNENIEGDTPLILACKNENINKNIIKYLIENGANTNKENKMGDTSLIIAIKNKNKKLINYLINLNKGYYLLF